MPSTSLVTLHVWGVHGHLMPAAGARMAIDRMRLRTSGAGFTRLLGTATGYTTADPGHWALLATWPQPQDAVRFEQHPSVRGWNRIGHERLTVRMRPLRSTGRWAGRVPFGVPDSPARPGYRIAALTRARVRPSAWRRFRKVVPPIEQSLSRGGPLLGFGIGELPIGLQATFSIWADEPALARIARDPGHRHAVARARAERWYAEDLFARFEVLELSGSYRGVEYR